MDMARARDEGGKEPVQLLQIERAFAPEVVQDAREAVVVSVRERFCLHRLPFFSPVQSCYTVKSFHCVRALTKRQAATSYTGHPDKSEDGFDALLVSKGE